VATTSPRSADGELTIDKLAARAGLPTRTIREYQTMGLLPSPDKRGRIGIYGQHHVHRLELIGRLQERGYSLAGIRDLLGAWSDGSDLSQVLGLLPDELVHAEEPGTAVTLDQLARLLPSFVPSRLDDILAVGLIDVCGPDRYCVPSPSLLQLTIDALAAGYKPREVLSLLTAIHDAAEVVATAADKLLSRPPAGLDDDGIAQLATRGRGLLAHGTGRLTVYALGRRLEREAPARRAVRSR